MDTTRSVATAIKLNRTARGWRQTDLASALGVSRQRITLIESGCIPLGASILRRIADVFGCEPLDAFISTAERAGHRR